MNEPVQTNPMQNPQMGGNPYDLVGNGNQQMQQPVYQQVPMQTVPNTNPVGGQAPQVAAPAKESGFDKFIKKVVDMIAKMTGQNAASGGNNATPVQNQAQMPMQNMQQPVAPVNYQAQAAIQNQVPMQNTMPNMQQPVAPVNYQAQAAVAPAQMPVQNQVPTQNQTPNIQQPVAPTQATVQATPAVVPSPEAIVPAVQPSPAVEETAAVPTEAPVAPTPVVEEVPQAEVIPTETIATTSKSVPSEATTETPSLNPNT